MKKWISFVILINVNECRRHEFTLTVYTAAGNRKRQLISFAGINEQSYGENPG